MEWLRNSFTNKTSVSGERSRASSNSSLVVTEVSIVENDDQKKTVSFGTIEIREYPMILGDNPSVSKGAPLTIDWEHQREITLDVAEYEDKRPERRSYIEMTIPATIRQQILLKHTSKDQIRLGVKKVNIARKNRRYTQERLGLEKLDMMGEKFKRKIVHAFRPKLKQDGKKLLVQGIDLTKNFIEEKGWKEDDSVRSTASSKMSSLPEQKIAKPIKKSRKKTHANDRREEEEQQLMQLSNHSGRSHASDIDEYLKSKNL